MLLEYYINLFLRNKLIITTFYNKTTHPNNITSCNAKIVEHMKYVYQYTTMHVKQLYSVLL